MFGPRNHTPRIGSPATESVARLAVTATAAVLLAAGLTGCSTPEAADASGPRLATQPVAAEIDEAAATAADAANTAADATGDDDDGAAAQANAGNGSVTKRGVDASRSGGAPAPTLAKSVGKTARQDRTTTAESDAASDAGPGANSDTDSGASSGNGSRAAAEPAPGTGGTADIAADAAERCTGAALAQSGFTGPATFLYCDGDWALAGPPNTDIIVALHWADGWRLYEGHGQTETGFTCYDPAIAAADGVPEGLRAKLLTCN